MRDREPCCGRPPATPQLAESHPRCSCFTPAELLRNAFAGCSLLLLLPFLPPSQELGQQPAGFQLRTLGSEPPVVPVPLLAAKCAPVASPVTRCHPLEAAPRWRPSAERPRRSRDRQGSAELPLQLGQGGAPRRKGCCCNTYKPQRISRSRTSAEATLGCGSRAGVCCSIIPALSAQPSPVPGGEQSPLNGGTG